MDEAEVTALMEEYNTLVDQIKVLESMKSAIYRELQEKHGLSNGQILYKTGSMRGLNY